MFLPFSPISGWQAKLIHWQLSTNRLETKLLTKKFTKISSSYSVVLKNISKKKNLNLNVYFMLNEKLSLNFYIKLLYQML